MLVATTHLGWNDTREDLRTHQAEREGRARLWSPARNGTADFFCSQAFVLLQTVLSYQNDYTIICTPGCSHLLLCQWVARIGFLS